MIGGNDTFRAEIQRGQVFVYRKCQRINISRIIVIGRHGADRGHPAQFHQRLECLVIDRCSRCGAVLRVERKNHDPLATLIAQCFQSAFD